MAEIKGFAIRGLLKFVKESNYPGGIPAVLSRLSADEQELFASPITSSGWYPYSTFAHLLRVIDQTVGKGDVSQARRIGEVSAERDVHGVFKIIGAMAGFQTLLPRSPIFWPRYFNRGKLVALDVGDRGARLQIHDFPEIDPIHCIVLEGWFEKIGGLFGAKNVRVRHTACVHRGSLVCEYTITYG